MIVFINQGKSKPKSDVWRFIISYYDNDERPFVEKIRNVSRLRYGKFAFTMSYIEWYNLCKDWEKRTGFKVRLHAEDFYLIYYVHPIKVKQEQRDKDLDKLVKLDGDVK